MNKELQILLLFITLSFFSCNRNIIPIANIDTDFPVTEKLEFKPVHKYDVYEGACFIDDSVLWYFGGDKFSIGSCYSLNTGEKLSAIAMRGKASYEFTDSPGFEFVGDSIQFYTSYNSIKTFAKKDIVNNKPMGERKFSEITCPDTILVCHMIKLPNGSVLATIRSINRADKDYMKNEINKNSVVIFNENEAKAYETIKYDSFDVKEKDGSERDKYVTVNDQIKSSYADGIIAIKDNDMVVFSVGDQFILYTFDLNSGNVVKEKRYTKMQGWGTYTTNDMGLHISNIVSNDKYIVSLVGGYFNKNDKERRSYGSAIFVFDWDLNPIKRIDLPYEKKVYYTISNDCNSVYSYRETEDGTTLFKADLNL